MNVTECMYICIYVAGAYNLIKRLYVYIYRSNNVQDLKIMCTVYRRCYRIPSLTLAYTMVRHTGAKDVIMSQAS